jgi:hypothetical protein
MSDDIRLFEDKKSPGDWRVEYVGDDGSCFVNIFAIISKPCGPERCSRIGLPTDTQRNGPDLTGKLGDARSGDARSGPCSLKEPKQPRRTGVNAASIQAPRSMVTST